MRKPTEIIDYLLERMEGLDRRDLEARLKYLRTEGLWPRARSVGDQKAEPVDATHCANLIMALGGSDQAMHCVKAVKKLAALKPRTRWQLNDESSASSAIDIYQLDESDPFNLTFGFFLRTSILTRNPKKIGSLKIDCWPDIRGVMISIPDSVMLLNFGLEEQSSRLISQRLIPGEIFEMMADFLDKDRETE